MKFPEHIIIDFQKNNVFGANTYWIHSYLLTTKNSFIRLNRYTKAVSLIYKRHFNWTYTKFANDTKYTTQHSTKIILPITYKSIEWDKLSLATSKLRTVTNVKSWKRTTNRWKFDKFFLNFKILNKNKFKIILKKYLTQNNFFIFKDAKLWQLFDINFLRKEKLYTKLKYSRTPQYDIVSGGSAALLSGFLGFLICEKFGFELLDSGDFYYLFMYGVFTLFFTRLFIKLFTNEKNDWNPLSYKWSYMFFKINVLFLFNNFKNIFKYNFRRT